jgi:cyanophycinase
MSSNQKRGKLVIIGEAEDKEGDCIILREFVRCAGGSKAKIVVLTAATGDLKKWEKITSEYSSG